MRTALAALIVIMGLAGCAVHRPPDKLVLQSVAFENLEGWNDDNHSEALGAFLKSCAAFAARPDDDITGTGDLLAPITAWKAVCGDAAGVPADNDAAARVFFERDFMLFRATNNGNPSGLFTGYYEPLLRGAILRHPPYVYPVYALPEPGFEKLYTRQQIDNGALSVHANVIAYTDDPVALFFLQIQGSGRIQLEDGTVLHVGYAGANGQPYVSIGKVLADRGVMKKDDITMPLLRQWLNDHPYEMWDVMWQNPSYVYFRTLDGDAVGSQKAPLTPGRSLAVDTRFITLGMPVYINTMLPRTSGSPPVIIHKLMVAQDTGGAIRGPVRGDIFFGAGAQAEEIAGALKSGGEYTLFVPSAIATEILMGVP